MQMRHALSRGGNQYEFEVIMQSRMCYAHYVDGVCCIINGLLALQSGTKLLGHATGDHLNPLRGWVS